MFGKWWIKRAVEEKRPDRTTFTSGYLFQYNKLNVNDLEDE